MMSALLSKLLIKALAVSASSWKSRPATPEGVTMPGVPLERHPDEGDLDAPGVVDPDAGEQGPAGVLD
jgi:hypothetical protein